MDNYEEVPIIDIPISSEQQAEFDAAIAAEPARFRAEVEEARRQSYQREADPLYFGWQRGDNTEQEWLDAVQKVKDENPYPPEPKAKK